MERLVVLGNIQVLRAFAAINVVMFHIIGTSASYNQATRAFSFLEGWGASGVDIFFVISGFVILHTQLIHRRTSWEFFKSRLVRIVPIYWVVTAFVVALYLILPSVFRDMTVTPLWIASSLFFVSSLLTGKHPVVYVGWTLEWEMFFYLVFAAGLLFSSWRVQIAFVVAIVASVAMATGHWIILEFLLGMAIAGLFRLLKISNIGGFLIFMAGAAALLFSLAPGLKSLAMDRFFVWGLPSFLIVLGSVFSRQIKNHAATFLGDASYSIYLVQMLTVPAFYKISSKYLAGLHGDLLALLCLGLSVAFGCLIYRLIEKPLINALKHAHWAGGTSGPGYSGSASANADRANVSGMR